MNTNDRIWFLMARTLADEARDEEREELLSFLQKDEELADRFSILSKLWTAKEDQPSGDKRTLPESQNLRKILKRAEEEREAGGPHQEKDTEPKPRFLNRNRFLLLCAASIALFAILFYSFPRSNGRPQSASLEIVTVKDGSRTKLLLPDGTSVWLNGDSKLFYSKTFGKRQREVRLEGEAFFDVVKDPTRPFIVHVGRMNIRVLGTAFNVKFYDTDKNFETTLLRGKIEVTENRSNGKAAIFLKPNQKLVVPLKTMMVSPKIQEEYQIENIDKKLKEDERLETAWMYNRIEFRGDNFEELGKKLERWYNIRIVFADENVKSLKFNGSFEKETIEEALNALQKVASFKYQLNEREVLIKSSE